MKRRILALLVALALVALVVPAAVFAADTGMVSCTVSAVLVSVNVTDGSVAYGTLALNATKSTINLSDTQTATNSGTVAENFTIKSSNATRIGGTNWTLASTIGSNQYKHEFSTNSSFPGTAMTTSYQTLKTNVAASGNQTFDLQITMPISTTDYLEHTITVTVMASL